MRDVLHPFCFCDILHRYFTADNIADGIQNICICVEMLFCALAHMHAFSYKPYVTTPYKSTVAPLAITKCCGSFSEPVSCFLFVINPIDLWQDFVSFIKLKSAEVKHACLCFASCHTSHVISHTSHFTLYR